MSNFIDRIQDDNGTTYDIHSNTVKAIRLEVMPCLILETLEPITQTEDWRNMRSFLRLNLIGFNDTDVGSHIWLLRRSLTQSKYKSNSEPDTRKIRKKGFRHPANYNSDRRDICKMGFGVIAGKKSGSRYEGQPINFQTVPSWMPHNGFVQTEWEITQEHIQQGYIDIDIGKEFLSLLVPNTKDPNNPTEFIFIEAWQVGEPEEYNIEYGQTGVIGRGAQFITYCQIKDDVPVCFSSDTILFSSNGDGRDQCFYKCAPIIDQETGERRISCDPSVTLKLL